MTLLKNHYIFCFLISLSLSNIRTAQSKNLTACLDKANSPISTLECFRGLPYRVDGALDNNGRWTLWANQGKEFNQPGLNCSGLTTAVSRSIFNHNIPLNQAKNDRLKDAGKNSSMGEDWNFGINLILNLTDNLPRKLIPNPYEGKKTNPRSWSAHDLRGISIDSSKFLWLLNQVKKDHIYYFSISKPDSRFKGGLSFYHVGFFIRDHDKVWMYHATGKGNVYRVNIAGQTGVNWFRKFYRTTNMGSKYMQLIEVPLSS